MRYAGNGPRSIPAVLEQLRTDNTTRILLVPMYPQFSASTTATAIDQALNWVTGLRNQPELRYIRNFADDRGYINAIADQIKAHWQHNPPPPLPDNSYRLVMSFHGLPERNLKLGDPYFCECHKTARLVAEALNLTADSVANDVKAVLKSAKKSERGLAASSSVSNFGISPSKLGRSASREGTRGDWNLEFDDIYSKRHEEEKKFSEDSPMKSSSKKSRSMKSSGSVSNSRYASSDVSHSPMSNSSHQESPSSGLPGRGLRREDLSGIRTPEKSSLSTSGRRGKLTKSGNDSTRSVDSLSKKPVKMSSEIQESR
jgi:hypothetical protein